MIRKHLRWMAAIFMATNLAVVSPGTLLAGPNDRDRNRAGFDPAAAYQTTTRIKQVVVIFQENRFVRPLLRHLSDCDESEG